MPTTHDDLTIDELLNDPLILALRKADRVDAPGFERMLRDLAADRRRVPTRSVPAIRADAVPSSDFPSLPGFVRHAQAAFGFPCAW